MVAGSANRYGATGGSLTLPYVDISTNRLHIDPAGLAGTIRHYVDHPEDRASIADRAT